MEPIYALYAVIVFAAPTIGAIAGLGGGIIIKPLSDILGYNDASTIGILSAFAVFTMSVVSIIKQFKNDTIIKIDLVLIMSFGALIGGLCGETLFQLTKGFIGNDIKVKIIQSALLFLTLVVIVVYRIYEGRIKKYHLMNWFAVFIVGLSLGTISIFLGIGGGPLNIIILSFLFSFEVKESVLYSIIMVFFAQISKLSQVYFTNQFANSNMNLIIWVYGFALLGGYIGSHINRKISADSIRKVYNYTMVTHLLISLYNVIYGLSLAS